jgi:hypothetical protein
MKTFYVWATLLTSATAHRLTSGLVEKGYSVGPLASSRRLCVEGEASVFAALKVDSGLDTVDQSLMIREVKEVLSGIGSVWHSLVVFEVGGSCTWEGSNIKLPPREEKVVEDPKEVPKTRFDLMGKDSVQ